MYTCTRVILVTRVLNTFRTRVGQSKIENPIVVMRRESLLIAYNLLHCLFIKTLRISKRIISINPRAVKILKYRNY